MAWAEKLPGGKTWRGCWRDARGKQCRTSRATHPEHPYVRKKDAVAAARQAEVKAARTAASETGTLAASITWSEWWEVVHPDRPDSDSAIVDRSRVRLYVMPKWGECQLNRISSKMVKAWVREDLSKLSPSYARRVWDVFRWSINRAIEDEVLDASPCVGVKLPVAPKRAKKYATEDSLAKLDQLDATGKPCLRAEVYRDLKDLGFETGLRPNELCGIHEDQVDLVGGWLDVTNVFVTRRRVIRGTPKDRDARRVPLTERAVEILRRWIERLPNEPGCGVPHSDGSVCTARLLFRTTRGGPVTPQTYQRALLKASRRAGIPSQTPYSLRRGMATWAAEGGLDPFALKEILGHADLDETAGYVQQTPAARARFRAARGEQTGLSVVGQDQEKCGRSGADPLSASVAESGIDPGVSAV